MMAHFLIDPFLPYDCPMCGRWVSWGKRKIWIWESKREKYRAGVCFFQIMSKWKDCLMCKRSVLGEKFREQSWEFEKRRWEQGLC